MSVRVSSGSNSFTSAGLVGKTVDWVRSNSGCQQVLGLVGGETAEMSFDDGDSWETVDEVTVLQEDSQLRFVRKTGEKG